MEEAEVGIRMAEAVAEIRAVGEDMAAAMEDNETQRRAAGCSPFSFACAVLRFDFACGRA
jgi:hypothetical protein